MSSVVRAKGGVCAAKGFLAAAAHCGIKPGNHSKDDLALIVSRTPAVAAAVFTRNRVKAAPVLISREHLRRSHTRGVLLNSGNANACTGSQGLAAARAMLRAAAGALGCRPAELLVCSTGRIGVQLPLEKILPVIPVAAAALARSAGTEAARAIMTSDTFPKESARRVRAEGGSFHIGGMAKGAGMINPDMATMLCVLTTDVEMEKPLLRSLLREAVEESFNRITVDGDTSTNDTVMLFANGAAGVKVKRTDRALVRAFGEALTACCRDLARDIVRDGEGTNKVITVEVQGARSSADARRAAQAVANSILVKCAWAGGDPNWGRILDALGYSGAVFDPAKVRVAYDGVSLFERGAPARARAAAAAKVAARPAFTVHIDLGAGRGQYAALTTDLTEEFVRLNLSE